MSVSVGGVVSSGAVDPASKSLKEDVGSSSGDGDVTLVVAKGTVATKADGSPVQMITVTPNNEPPGPGDDKVFVAQTVDVGPFGATISSPMKLTLRIDPGLLSEGTDVSKLTIFRFDAATSRWIPVKSVVDAMSNTISADIDVFGTYAVMGPGNDFVEHLALYLLAGLALLAAATSLFLVAERTFRIVFATAPQEVVAGDPSNAITVRGMRKSGKVISAPGDIVLNLSSTSVTGTFDLVRSGAFDGSVKTVVLRKGEKAASFYYKDINAATAAIAVVASGRKRVRATQLISVKRVPKIDEEGKTQ